MLELLLLDNNNNNFVFHFHCKNRERERGCLKEGKEGLEFKVVGGGGGNYVCMGQDY
jgi:hypothetical protein